MKILIHFAVLLISFIAACLAVFSIDFIGTSIGMPMPARMVIDFFAAIALSLAAIDTTIKAYERTYGKL